MSIGQSSLNIDLDGKINPYSFEENNLYSDLELLDNLDLELLDNLDLELRTLKN